MNVSAESSSVTIVELDGSLAYSVQVSAGTEYSSRGWNY